MAAEQSGAEASPGTTKPAGAARQPDDAPSEAPDEPDTAKPDLDEVKRKFREALERKRGAHGSANAEGAQDTGKVHGSHGPVSTRRSFRRKSGG
jgi:Family of unknown function (DUF5302)